MKAQELKSLLLEITKSQGLDVIYQTTQNLDVYEPIYVAFLGEFSTGKSTLINALVKKNLIPTMDIPTDAAPVEIRPAKEDKIQVLRYVNDQETITDIDSNQLSEKEIFKAEPGKRIIIHTSSADILKDNIVLIDTAGLSSTNKIHTDLTLGVLPKIDAAIVTISALYGDVTASLISFLEENILIREGLKDRIIFCVTMLDSIPTYEEREKVLAKIQETLTKIIPAPRIIQVSPKEILEFALYNEMDKYNNSSIKEIIKFISVELPEKQNAIWEEKLCNNLKEIKIQIISQLEEKRKAIDYSTSDLDEKMGKTKLDIEELNRQQEEFQREMKKKEENIRYQVLREANTLIELIISKAARATKEEDYSAEMKEFTQKIQDIIFNNYTDFHISHDITDFELGEIINNKIRQIKKWLDRIAKTITMILPAVLIPGQKIQDLAGVVTVILQGEGKVTIQEDKNNVDPKPGKFSRILGTLGRLLEEINPVESLKDIAESMALKKQINSKVTNIVNTMLNSIFEDINYNLNNYIEETYSKPLKQNYETLQKVREAKNQKIDALDKLKEKIKSDINQLHNNDC